MFIHNFAAFVRHPAEFVYDMNHPRCFVTWLHNRIIKKSCLYRNIDQLIGEEDQTCLNCND